MAEDEYILLKVETKLEEARRLIGDAAAYDVKGLSKELQLASKTLHSALRKIEINIDTD